MTTATKTYTVRHILNLGNANDVADCAAKVKLGNALSKIKATFVGLTSSATQNITTAAAKAAATLSGITLDTGELLPAIGQVVTLRVTAGAAAAASRDVTDAGGTASASLALLSDDGTTLTFEAAVTAFVLTYYPVAENINSSFPLTAP